ncbi:hypothetical protein Tco_1398501 [Tanacetum coccineum]
MLQKQKQLKKHVDYEQLINVFAMDKSMLKEELRATKSKLKSYDRLFFIMLGSFSVVCAGFGMLIATNACSKANATCKANACYKVKCKCNLQILVTNACCKCNLQMQVANACSKTNATCKTNAYYKGKLQMLAAKKMQPARQMFAVNACNKANATCKENACCKCKLQMLATKQMQPARQMITVKASFKCLQQSKCNL